MSLFLKIINLFLGSFFNFLSVCKTNEMGAYYSSQLKDMVVNMSPELRGEFYEFTGTAAKDRFKQTEIGKKLLRNPKFWDDVCDTYRNKESFDVNEFQEIHQQLKIQKRDKQILYDYLMYNYGNLLSKRELKELGLRDNEEWIKIWCKNHNYKFIVY